MPARPATVDATVINGVDNPPPLRSTVSTSYR